MYYQGCIMYDREVFLVIYYVFSDVLCIIEMYYVLLVMYYVYYSDVLLVMYYVYYSDVSYYVL